MSASADELARIEAHLEHHWFALALHQAAIRDLLPMRDMLRAAVEREEAKVDRQARKFMGPDARRSA